MGQILGRLIDRFAESFLHRELRILMLGLDAAGKTTVLYKLKLGEKISTIPTIGFNLETVKYKNVHFTVWDVGGQQKIRVLWRHYFTNVQGLIFVVDSVDKVRVKEARHELHNLMSDTELSRVALLVFANKSDVPSSMSVTELTDKLQLTRFTKNKWYIQNCCATSGEGLLEGLNWLSSALKNVR